MTSKEKVLKLLPTCFHRVHPLGGGSWYDEIYYPISYRHKKYDLKIGSANEDENKAWERALEFIEQSGKDLSFKSGNYVEFRLYGMESFLKKGKVRFVTRISNPKKAVCIVLEGSNESFWIPFRNIRRILKTSVGLGTYSGFHREDITAYHVLELDSWAIENIILKEENSLV